MIKIVIIKRKERKNYRKLYREKKTQKVDFFICFVKWIFHHYNFNNNKRKRISWYLNEEEKNYSSTNNEKDQV